MKVFRHVVLPLVLAALAGLLVGVSSAHASDWVWDPPGQKFTGAEKGPGSLSYGGNEITCNESEVEGKTGGTTSNPSDTASIDSLWFGSPTPAQGCEVDASGTDVKDITVFGLPWEARIVNSDGNGGGDIHIDIPGNGGVHIEINAPFFGPCTLKIEGPQKITAKFDQKEQQIIIQSTVAVEREGNPFCGPQSDDGKFSAVYNRTDYGPKISIVKDD